MNIKEFFSELKDPRSPHNQTYPFECLMLISISAAMAGIDSYVGIEDYAATHKEFFDKYFNLKYTPTHDTFLRLYGLLDKVAFEQWFRVKTESLIAFINTQNPPDVNKLRHIAIDGKTIRNSGFLESYHIVTAWLADHKVALCQVTVAEKSNEITAIPELIKSQETLKNTVMTIDAMGCQKEICALIVEKEGSYIIGVKENQPTLFQSAQAQTEEKFEQAYSTHTTDDKGHGRKEMRYCLAQDVDTINFNYKDWPGIKTIYAVDTDTIQKRRGHEKRYFSTRYFVSNIRLNAAEALSIIRSHWGIEINLHWCLDVSFNEDGSCIQEEGAAINMNVLRKFALNVLTSEKGKKSFKSMFRHCMLPSNAIKILDKLYNA